MEFKLNLTQEQKLIMTQQMQLSVKLLQMSNFEIQSYIEKEIQENPVLDAEYKKNEIDSGKSTEEIDYKKFIKYLEFDDYGHGSYSKDEEEVSPFNFISAKRSLKEYLIEQIIELDESNEIKAVCKYMIENIDERGYLDITLDEIQKELNISKELSEKALKVIHGLDPLGIGARDIKECLTLQLKYKNVEDENLFIIIENYLEMIAENKYNIIAKDLKISVKEAQEYGDIIKSLEPKPSRGFFTGEEIKYIIPEAYIKKIDGEFCIIMNDGFIPKLNINQLYKQIINGEEDKDTVKFVKDKLNSAVFLIKSIRQRESTIYNILEKIVEIQKDYFQFGEEYLKPMTLKEIADSLEIHESTVSRAIRDKYIHTERGTIKIKDLFTTGISSMDSFDDISTKLIKKEIQELVDAEDKKKPYSDQKICDLLKKKNMDISRRTVAKYREEMGIKSSSKRKRF
ncbi:RNA polymerase sigma-54 factor 1 [Clostridium homopropionicum DSM 5847]|uniref:RNA polymerase sigma-54 factor 1 n=1 Tax=Clostridium homopropionicum DSM 5847 TaxID=1121318 RepID=A0A0L6ZCQ7_9CLOT|nr:RNA polymerase factor sigma-54 [Clostridium homopropionicum]KOA20750.1 RNA polymerase sigma-54 factor 1 [Clostridium homopropionicum DSM 5847]SFF89975.1 RNA polymerase, sigma 54 subunit, RpoN/SigL [Clostridium homopropionicum]